VLAIVFSWDPNDLIGPEGYGLNRYIVGHRETPFIILFENLPSAPGAAQEVLVTKQLNIERDDLNTVCLGPITFGNRLITPPAGVSSFATDVDLRPETNLIVRIVVTLNRNTGLLTWRFTSLDPATGDFPTDPTAGFLPPNRTSPEGSGSVSFTVMPKRDLPTGTQIRNKATIVFDFNEPILTPEWLNTIDKTAPSSRVSSLGSEQASPSFLVEWFASDEGAGVKTVTICVSEDGQPFTVWLENTSETSATFHGASGKNYRFYSVARDHVGNEESAPVEPDAVTRVMVQDAQPPIIVISGCQTMVNLHSTAAVNVSVTDADSGVAAQSVADGSHLLDTSTVGPKTFTVVAQDNAGNSSTNICSYHVIYDFLGAGGFRVPIDNPPVLNTAKAGSGIPVKWQLPDGRGGFISDLSVVISIQRQQVACEDISSAVSDPVETTASGDSGLRFDPATNEYLYIWKTEKTQAGKCYIFLLNLNDGRQYRANFSLR
jgi:hypothetical protein